MLEEWLSREFSKSEATQQTYRKAVKKFLLYIYESGDLDKLAERYISSDRDFLDDLADFAKWMQEEGLSPNTENLYIRILKEFMEEVGDKRIDERRWKRFRRRHIRKGKAKTADRAPSKKQLRQIISHLDAKGTSLFLFLASSGARIGEALELREEDVDLESDPPRAYIRGAYGKSDVGRWVFFSEEARNAIEEWLKEKSPSEKIWPFTSATARTMWNKALKSANLDEKDPGSGFYVYHIHTLRKFFRSNIRVEDDVREELLGHAGYLDNSYRRISMERKEEAYKEAMDSVSIYEKAGASKRELRQTELRTLRATLRAQGYDKAEIDNICDQWAAKMMARAERGYAYGAEGILTFEDIDLADLSEEEFEDLKEELLSLVTESNADDCPKQEIIEESKLKDFLEKGYRFVAHTNSGEVVVEK